METSEEQENSRKEMTEEVRSSAIRDVLIDHQERLDSLENPDLWEATVVASPDRPRDMSTSHSPKLLTNTPIESQCSVAEVLKDVVLAPDSQPDESRLQLMDKLDPRQIPCTFLPQAKSKQQFDPDPPAFDSTSLASPSEVRVEVSKDNILCVKWKYTGGGKDKTFNVYLQKRYGDTSWIKLNYCPLANCEYRHYFWVKPDVEYYMFLCQRCVKVLRVNILQVNYAEISTMEIN